MNEGSTEIPLPGRGPGEEVVKQTTEEEVVMQSTEKKNNGSERISEVVSPVEGLAPSVSLHTQENPMSAPAESGPGEANNGVKAPSGEPPESGLQEVNNGAKAPSGEPPESGPQEVNNGAKAPSGEPLESDPQEVNNGAKASSGGLPESGPREVNNGAKAPSAEPPESGPREVNNGAKAPSAEPPESGPREVNNGAKAPSAEPPESGPREVNNGAKAPSAEPPESGPREVNNGAKAPSAEPPESNNGAKAPSGEPPVDWFEPLEEDDDAQSWDLPFSYFNGKKDAEEESLAGESEKSGSVASSEKTPVKKFYQLNVHRRKRTHPDEGWEEWPALGQGWKRKEVIRRSGCSVGQKDVYYLSPHGDRLRSRVELASVLEGIVDLSMFEYKSGKFNNGVIYPTIRRKRKVKECSSSESSWMERGEGADTPDSHHKLTPNLGPKPSSKHTPSNQSSPLSHSTKGTPKRGPQSEDVLKDNRIKLPCGPPSRLLPAVNGQLGSDYLLLVCSKCSNTFSGTSYDKQRKKPFCPSCWATTKTKDHPLGRFRKWIPCGQCVACRTTMDCGQCANCKTGLQSPVSRKGLCRKKKCICPIRKPTKRPKSATCLQSVGAEVLSATRRKEQSERVQSPGNASMFHQSPEAETFEQSLFHKRPETETFEHSVSFQSELMESQHSSYQTSDTEDVSVNVDIDDDDEDMTTDDDDDWHKKRKRRSCGKCNACICRKDCGTCDFCFDKPKFGGSNRKRQKCRLRQCQRQAMRHLLPEPQDSSTDLGRRRPQYTYSRKTGPKTIRPAAFGLEFSENEDDNSNLRSMSWSPEPTSSGKPFYEMSYRNHQSSIQVDRLEYVQKNGLSEGVPNISLHTSSQLLGTPHATAPFSTQDRQHRWDGERPSSNKDVERLPGELVEKNMPMVTSIVSLAENLTASGLEKDDLLLKLLDTLRVTALPFLWSVIMVDGPRLQIIQCSKRSNMIDTMVLIDPGFCYQVTVQNQPLLVTHPLYDGHPMRLTSVMEVVHLLLDFERFRVCEGLPALDLMSHKGPVIFERASTCDFLVPKDVKSCANCRALCE